MNPHHSNLDLFWRFVAERQAVQQRRFVDLAPPPWTDDPIIRDNHFTNVYRELDKGTIWLRDHLDLAVAEGFVQNLYNIVGYRLVNRIETFEAWHEHSGSWFPSIAPTGPAAFVKWCEERKAAKEKVFTGRHLNVGLKGVQEALEWLANQQDRWFESLQRTRNGEWTIKQLLEIPRVGKFFAFQIYEDLCEDGWFDHHDDWAYLGPGAEDGMKLIWPIGGWSMKEFFWLRDNADAEFARLGIDFRYWVRPDTGEPQRLRAKDIEHSLCEFQKYHRMLNGGATSGKRG